jgi:hypothetical protein
MHFPVQFFMDNCHCRLIEFELSPRTFPLMNSKNVLDPLGGCLLSCGRNRVCFDSRRSSFCKMGSKQIMIHFSIILKRHAQTCSYRKRDKFSLFSRFSTIRSAYKSEKNASKREIMDCNLLTSFSVFFLLLHLTPKAFHTPELR